MSKLIVQVVSIAGLCLASASASAVQANSPKDLTDAYHSYEDALKAENYDDAQKSAYQAWQLAEAELGDSRTTGDLAQNYADVLAYNDVTFPKVRKVYKRAIELAENYPADEAFDVRLERTLNLSGILLEHGRLSEIARDLRKLTREAERANLPESTLLGEAYTLRALISLNSDDHRYKVSSLAQKSVAVYNAADDGFVSPYEDLARELVAISSPKPSSSLPFVNNTNLIIYDSLFESGPAPQ